MIVPFIWISSTVKSGFSATIPTSSSRANCKRQASPRKRSFSVSGSPRFVLTLVTRWRDPGNFMLYRNLAHLFCSQTGRFGQRVALRFKQHRLYHDLNWRDYQDQVLAGAAALMDAGIKPGERVGLLAENRVEWLIADLA